MVVDLLKGSICKFVEIIRVISFFINVKKVENKKVLIVGHDFAKAGAQVLLLNIIKEFSNRKIDVVMISRGNGPLEGEYRKVCKTYVATIDRIFELYIRRIKKLGYNVAITNTVVTGSIVDELKKNNFYVVSLIHELPNLIKEGGHLKSANAIANKSDVVVFPSTYVRDKFSELVEIKNNVLIKPQGLFLNKDHKVNKKMAKEKLHNKYLLPINNRLVINVATGIKRKGFDLFLDIAIKSIENKDISFIWVGDYKKEILDQVLKKNNMKDIPNLTLTGYINNPEFLAYFYDAADLLMLTSREEPFGSIVLEAFNSETPVIAFKDRGGYIDVVKQNRTGYLVDYCNIIEMQKKVIEVLNSKDIELISKECKQSLKQYKFEDYISYLINIAFN